MPSYNNTLEEIKSRIDIVDLISDYIPLKKTGQNWKGLCPFHSEKTPSFIVSPSKQIYHCFGCGNGGDVFTFLIKYENISFNESLDILAEKTGVTLKKYQKSTASGQEKESGLNLHKEACVFYQESLRKNARASNYLKNRRIKEEIQKYFSIGYAPDSWDALLSFLKKRGYALETIKKSGLITQGKKDYYDTFRNRIIFPIFNLRGEVVALGGRVIDDSMPKYLNSPESPIFSKSKILYGLHLAKESIKKNGFVIFVEGYLDVVTTHMYGFSNAVAPLGTALTKEHGKLIKRFTDDAVLVFDGDDSGVNAAKKGIGILLENSLNVKILPLPEGEDPDSILNKKGKDAFASLLEKAVSIVNFFVMQIGNGSHRKGDKYLICNEALEAIAKEPNNVKRGDYVKQLSENTGFNENDLREELKKIRNSPQFRDESWRAKRISDRGYSQKSEIRTASRPADEMYLLQLIIQFPEKAEKIFNSVTVDDFEDATIKSIFKKIRVGIDSSRDGLIDYNILITEGTEEERSLLTGLLFKSELESPEKILEDCLKRLKFKKRQRLLHELQDEIKNAEFKRDDDLLKALLLEKQKLLKLKV